MIAPPEYQDLIGRPYRGCMELVFEMYGRTGFELSVDHDTPAGYYWQDLDDWSELEPMDLVILGNEKHFSLYVGEDWLLHDTRANGVEKIRYSLVAGKVTRISRLKRCPF